MTLTCKRKLKIKTIHQIVGNCLRRINIKIVGLLIASTAVLCSCVNESFSENHPDDPEQEASYETYYAAFRLHIEDTEKSRSVFDSEYDDIDDIFNKGLPFERALYFPSDIPGSDEEEDAGQAIYHFALLVDENQKIVSNILPLEPLEGPFEKDNQENELSFTVYTKLFTTKDNINNFREFSGKIYVVLNASHSLVEAVKTIIAKDNDISSLKLSKGVNNDDILFLKNKNGAFITDKEGNRYFTMSSSMIIEGDKVVPAVNGNFEIFNNEEEARNNPVNIYVERLQSKYTVLFAKNNTQSYYYLSSTGGISGAENETGTYIPVKGLFIYPNRTPKKIQYVTSYSRSDFIDDRKTVEVKETDRWRINIVGWYVNGIEQEEFLFKNLDPNAGYTKENGWFQPSTEINIGNFWSEDPHYDKNDKSYYPDQYRPHKDDSSSTVNSWNEDATLKYFSFNDLSKRNLRNYTPENTFTSDLLGENPIDSKSHLRVGSHIIVTAQLIIPDETDGSKNFEHSGISTSTTVDSKGLLISGQNGVKSKFLMNDIYWEELAYKDYVVEYLGYWMLTAENQKIFGENDGYFYDNETGVKATGASFDIEEVYLKGTDNMVWLKPNKKLYIYRPSQRKYEALDPDKYKKLFFEHQNYFAQRLTDGRMYYAEGTYHNMTEGGYYENRDKTPIDLADFGTVRNNWYSYTIEFISAPGVPVSKPDEPIIPNNDPTVSGMGVSLKLIDWHKEIIYTNVSGQQRP